MSGETKVPVLLFDGQCAFCNGCVRWLLERERRPRYYFASLQSAEASPILEAYGVAQDDLSSLVVIDAGKLYVKSSAALHLLRDTRWPWRMLRIFVLVPRALRDPLYNFIGARRYSWWGTAESCIVTDPAYHARVLAAPTASFQTLNKHF